MRVASRLTLLAIVGGSVLGIACGDSSSPVVPGSLAIAEGNGQEFPTGTPLPVALKVTVLGSNNQALANAAVSWAVTGGSATLGGTTSTSDALGAATMTVTLGGTIGPVSVRASMPGVTPVTFSATALDPCQYLWPHTFGTSVDRTIASTDCNIGGYYADLYEFTVASQQSLSITMSSGTLATWIDLFRLSDGHYLGANGDSVVSTPAVLNAIVAPGDYVIAPNTYFTFRTGPYTLSTAARPQTIAGCSEVWVTRGITVTEAVATSDCTDSAGPFFADVVLMFGAGGSVLTVAERSTAFDAYLTLFNGQGTEVAFNDDSANAGTTTDAYLVATLPDTNLYFLVIGTAGVSETGAYTLTISSSTTLSGSVSAAAPPVASDRSRQARAWRLPIWRASDWRASTSPHSRW
ncbi:MAG TPA: hypothetical protein VGQ06_11815 [Gemmatimonadales bacterium]|jgi:hypothetical protein|nr:hypothetical protein [Gemmatimonadales bacterium]